MFEILISLWLWALLSGAPSPLEAAVPAPGPGAVPADAQASKQCEARAQGVAAALSAAETGSFEALEQAGIRVNPHNVLGEKCVVAITDDVHSIKEIDGIQKIGYVGPTRYAVIWRNN